MKKDVLLTKCSRKQKSNGLPEKKAVRKRAERAENKNLSESSASRTLLKTAVSRPSIKTEAASRNPAALTERPVCWLLFISSPSTEHKIRRLKTRPVGSLRDLQKPVPGQVCFLKRHRGRPAAGHSRLLSAERARSDRAQKK